MSTPSEINRGTSEARTSAPQRSTKRRIRRLVVEPGTVCQLYARLTPETCSGDGHSPRCLDPVVDGNPLDNPRTAHAFEENARDPPGGRFLVALQVAGKPVALRGCGGKRTQTRERPEDAGGVPLRQARAARELHGGGNSPCHRLAVAEGPVSGRRLERVPERVAEVEQPPAISFPQI